jgi:hypothetical protein
VRVVLSLAIVALGALSIGPGARTQAQAVVPACYGGARYTGTLSFTGDYDYQPNGVFYYSAASGLHKGCLVGPAGADFDLFLLRWNGSAWVIIASSQSSSSNETISTLGVPGYYRWQIYSYNGSGSYNFWRASP